MSNVAHFPNPDEYEVTDDEDYGLDDVEIEAGIAALHAGLEACDTDEDIVRAVFIAIMDVYDGESAH